MSGPIKRKVINSRLVYRLKMCLHMYMSVYIHMYMSVYMCAHITLNILIATMIDLNCMKLTVSDHF